MKVLNIFLSVLPLTAALVAPHPASESHSPGLLPRAPLFVSVEDNPAAPLSPDQNQKREQNLPVEGAKEKCRYRCPSKCGVLKGICHNKQGSELRACHLDICKKDHDCAEACCGLNCPAPEAEAEAEVEVRRSNDYELSDTPAQVSTLDTPPLTPEPNEELSMVAVEAPRMRDNKRNEAMTTTSAASPSLSLEPRKSCPLWCGAIIELVCTNYWGMWDYCVNECLKSTCSTSPFTTCGGDNCKGQSICWNGGDTPKPSRRAEIQTRDEPSTGEETPPCLEYGMVSGTTGSQDGVRNCPKRCDTDCGHCAENSMMFPPEFCKKVVCTSCFGCGINSCDAYCKRGGHHADTLQTPDEVAQLPDTDVQAKNRVRRGIAATNKLVHADIEPGRVNAVERSASPGTPDTAAYGDCPQCCPRACKQLGPTCRNNQACIVSFCHQHPECAVNIHCQENRMCWQARRGMGWSAGIGVNGVVEGEVEGE